MTEGTSFAKQEPTNPGEGAPDQGTPTPPDGSFSTDPGSGHEGQLSKEQIDAIIKRDQHAQEHIRRLEEEASQRREYLEKIESEHQQTKAELDKMGSFESILEQRLQGQARSQEHAGGDQTPVDPNDIAQKVMSQIQEREQKAQFEKNKAEAIEAAKARYGSDKFLDTVGQRAAELGMTLDDVDDLAARRPGAFRELFIGKSDKEARHKPSVSGQVRADVDDSATSAELRELYRQDRKKYFTSQENFDRIAASLKK